MITELGDYNGTKHQEFRFNTTYKCCQMLKNRIIYKFRGRAYGTSLFYVLRSNNTGYLCNHYPEVHNH